MSQLRGIISPLFLVYVEFSSSNLLKIIKFRWNLAESSWSKNDRDRYSTEMRWMIGKEEEEDKLAFLSDSKASHKM